MKGWILEAILQDVELCCNIMSVSLYFMLQNVDIKNGVKYSTSAVDVCCCFSQVNMQNNFSSEKSLF